MRSSRDSVVNKLTQVSRGYPNTSTGEQLGSETTLHVTSLHIQKFRMISLKMLSSQNGREILNK